MPRGRRVVDVQASGSGEAPESDTLAGTAAHAGSCRVVVDFVVGKQVATEGCTRFGAACRACKRQPLLVSKHFALPQRGRRASARGLNRGFDDARLG